MRTEPQIVESDDNGIRVDRWFKRHYPALGHGTLEKLLRTGQVRVDGKRAKAGDRLQPGQAIRIPPQLEVQKPAEPKPAKTTSLTDADKKLIQDMVIFEDPS